jgi:hypothetical protein
MFDHYYSYIYEVGIDGKMILKCNQQLLCYCVDRINRV